MNPIGKQFPNRRGGVAGNASAKIKRRLNFLQEHIDSVYAGTNDLGYRRYISAEPVRKRAIVKSPGALL